MAWQRKPALVLKGLVIGKWFSLVSWKSLSLKEERLSFTAVYSPLLAFLYPCLVVPLSSLNIFSTRNVSKMNSTMWELVRKYIRCSSRTTIGHIKKYLKLKLKLSAVDQVKQQMKATTNGPFPSCSNSHFQNEAKCKTFLVKISVICMGTKSHFHIDGIALTLALKQRIGKLEMAYYRGP